MAAHIKSEQGTRGRNFSIIKIAMCNDVPMFILLPKLGLATRQAS